MLQAPSIENLALPTPEGSAEPVIDGARTFVPREDTELKGVLVKAAPPTKAHAERVDAGLAPLEQLVRLATDWPVSDADLASRIGDYRYFVVEFSRAPGQLLYVQIWSEPHAHLIVEVGPGEPKNRALKSLMARQTAALRGRGFQISGNARNFTKRLPTPRGDDDVTRVAHELLALLKDVLGYKGAVDLAYALRQGTHLDSAHVTRPMPRVILAALLSAWGLHAESLADDDTMIRSQSHDFDFTLHLTSPSKQSSTCYWEIHCNTSFPVPSGDAAAILSEINSKTWLLKAHELGTFSETQTLISLAYGINLAGGVTLDHIKSQIFEWLHNVQHFRSKTRAPDAALRLPVPDAPVSSTVH